jgi:mono/diheme cytochrome c family protein
MTRKLTVLLAITSLVLAAINLACSSSPATPPTTNTSTNTSTGVSFRNIVQPIFSQSCIVCHQGSFPSGGLSLEPAVVFSELVNVPGTESNLKLVEPGAPEKSYLINKLNGTQVAAGGGGAQMPFGQPPLSQAQIDLISQWISEGAPNN